LRLSRLRENLSKEKRRRPKEESDGAGTQKKFSFLALGEKAIQLPYWDQ
jgi:hypothetical protein